MFPSIVWRANCPNVLALSSRNSQSSASDPLAAPAGGQGLGQCKKKSLCAGAGAASSGSIPYDGEDTPKIGRTQETAKPLEETTGGALLREVGPELAIDSEVCGKPYMSGVPRCSLDAPSNSRTKASVPPRCGDLKCAQYPDFFPGQQRP